MESTKNSLNFVPTIGNVYYCKLTDKTAKAIKKDFNIPMINIVGFCEEYEDRLVINARVGQNDVLFEIDELETFEQVDPVMYDITADLFDADSALEDLENIEDIEEL